MILFVPESSITFSVSYDGMTCDCDICHILVILCDLCNITLYSLFKSKSKIKTKIKIKGKLENKIKDK